jgi:hypothetical protein
MNVPTSFRAVTAFCITAIAWMPSVLAARYDDAAGTSRHPIQRLATEHAPAVDRLFASGFDMPPEVHGGAEHRH